MPLAGRRYFIFPLVILVAIAALLLAAWIGRITLAETAISSAMQDAGLTGVSIDIEQLDPDRSRLAKLAFELDTGSANLRLEARNGIINYQPRELIDGRIHDLVIDELVLHYALHPGAAAAPAGGEAPQPLAILAGVREALSRYLLFQQISIHNIRLEGDGFGVLQDKDLALDCRANGASLAAELSLLDTHADTGGGAQPQLVIAQLSSDGLAAQFMLAASGQSAGGIELTFGEPSPDGTGLTGKFRLDAVAMQRWLQPFADSAALQGIGKLDGTLDMKFETDRHAHASVNATLDAVNSEAVSLKRIALKLDLDYANDGNSQHLSVLHGSYLSAAQLKRDTASVDSLKINLDAEFIASGTDWQASGNANADRLALQFGPQSSGLKNIQLHVAATPDRLDASGQFSPAELPGRFGIALHHRLMDGAGTLDIKPLQAIDLDAEHNQLSRLLKPWPYTFDLLAGNIRLSAHGAWAAGSAADRAFGLTTQLALENGGGHVGEMVFSGLGFEHELEILPTLHTLKASPIRLAHIDSGVVVSNISTLATLKTADDGSLPRLVAKDLHGELLGGSFSADTLVFDFNRSINRFTIKAKDIDLAEIVKTQQLKDISATGRIDGSLPISIGEAGISIEHGAFLNNVRAGTIRYAPASGTDQLRQNPITGIALDALRDFRYSELSAGVNFTPAGLLSIDIHLKGTSPELDDKRPVHLNINTEQNLLSLLKSLRFAQGVSDKIDAKVRTQYEKSGSNP